MTDFVFYVTLLPFVLFTCKRPSSYVLANDIVLNLRYLKQSLVAGSLLALESKGITTPSVKQRVKRQGPIRMHCDAPKWVPDPFASVMASVKTSKLTLGVVIA